MILTMNFFIYKNQIYAHDQQIVKQFILDKHHRNPYVAHYGDHKLITITRKYYFCPQMKKEVTQYLVKFLECQQVKSEHQHLVGTLPTTHS